MLSDFKFSDMIDRIKERKKELKITNRQLSELSGVSYGTLNKILGSETQEPSITNIIKISQALGLETEYVIHGKKNNATDNSDIPSESLALNISDSELTDILNRLSDKSLSELESYLDYLLWKQDQES